MLDYLQWRSIVAFGADVWASDWNPMAPDEELRLIPRRILRACRGVVLLHDTRAETARTLPAFLRALKRRGYRIVHIVPAGRDNLFDWAAVGTVAFLPASTIFYWSPQSLISR